MQKSILLDGRQIKYEIVIRKVKNPRMEFRSGSLVVIAPKRFSGIEEMLVKHKRWIIKRDILIEKANTGKHKVVDEFGSVEAFRNYVEERTSRHTNKLKVKCTHILFRKMKARWGSCSSKGHITINSRMINIPKSYVNYIVFHEVAHLKVRNHSKQFYSVIEKEFSNYKTLDQDLFYSWFVIKDRV